MMYLDLDELSEVLKLSRFWSEKAWRPARFRRSDFLGDPTTPLGDAVRQRIRQETGEWHQGPIRLLANLRYFGFNINPISCYYCFDQQNVLQYIVAEVTNTPWQERQSYVLKCDPQDRFQRINFRKLMHVSPFNPMEMEYHWCSNDPGKILSLNLECRSGESAQVDATMALKRHDINEASLRGVIFRMPWMTVKVAGAIYWQALKLWLKRIPVYDHPKLEKLSPGSQPTNNQLKL